MASFAFQGTVPAPALSTIAHDLRTGVARLSGPHREVVVRLAEELERAEADVLRLGAGEGAPGAADEGHAREDESPQGG